MARTVYNKAFFDDQQDGSVRSAKAVWPVVFEYVSPKSVLDIGCGVGTWLSVLNDFNIEDCFGLDGDYVNPAALLIPKEKFQPFDLTKPYVSPRKFDLAISLEVGEHLPDASAATLVRSLTGASDVILFSAAVPGQRGTYHINEQWPEYWAAKFQAEGFVPVDCVRKQIWANTAINVWYRQNILFYVRKSLIDQNTFPKLSAAAASTDPDFLTRIHPELFTYNVNKLDSVSTLTGFVRSKLASLLGK